MKSDSRISSVVQAINNGRQYPALKIIGANPEIAAVISKMVKPQNPGDFNLAQKDSYYNLNQGQIQTISQETQGRIADNENIMSLFPDLELAIQIVTSSVLSPKDMVKEDIVYRLRENILPAELALKMNDVLATTLENQYRLKDDLEEILREILFSHGSHIRAVLPESIVDEIINGNVTASTESLSELFNPDNSVASLGILGNSGQKNERIGLETFSGRMGIQKQNPTITIKEGDQSLSLENVLEISDNFKLLKLPKVMEAHNRSRLREITRTSRKRNQAVIATEHSKITNIELSGLIYKAPDTKFDTFVTIPGRSNQRRKSVGRPLVMRLPSESVIPVYVPGDPSNHVGYFVLIDEEGNPVNAASEHRTSEGLSSLLKNSQGSTLSSMLISKSRNNLVQKSGEVNVDQITKIYASIIETDLVERLNNGLAGKKAKISDTQEIYRVMLSRALQAKFTRLVYLPADHATYFAVKFFPNGVGKSYLDDIKILTSLRAILLFAKVMSQAKSSINTTHVTMTLDPNDPDPQKSIEIAQHEVVKLRQMYFPLGINSPMDLTDWLSRAGLEWSFEGHPALPNTKFEFETKQLQHNEPNNDLDENLRKQTYMALGLSPEVVDNGFNSEFATTVVANNILLAKRVMQIQKKFTRLLTDHAQKIALNDSILCKTLLDILKENKALVEKFMSDDEKEDYAKDQENYLLDVVDRYIENLELDLPKPDITTVKTQTEAFDEYLEALDKSLAVMVSGDFITNDLAGDLAGNIDSLKGVLKAHYARQWMAENGYMTELGDIITTTEDGKPTIDLYDQNRTHMEGIMRSTTRFIAALKPAREAGNADLAALGTEPGESTSSPTETDPGSGDDFGLGGFDLDGSSSVVEEPTSTTTPPGEEKPTDDGVPPEEEKPADTTNTET